MKQWLHKLMLVHASQNLKNKKYLQENVDVKRVQK